MRPRRRLREISIEKGTTSSQLRLPLVFVLLTSALWTALLPSRVFATSRATHHIAYVNYNDSGFTEDSIPSANIFTNAITNGPAATTSPSASVTYNGMTFAPMVRSSLSSATLSSYDTLILFEVCDIATTFSSSQLSAINSYLAAGNKVLIFDGDRCAPSDNGGEGVANYSWFSYPFSTSEPGPQGASSALTLLENSSLTEGLGGDPFDSDELGDANTATSSDSHWYAAAQTTNTLGNTGYFLAYARNAGLAIYNGADYWNTEDPTKSLTDLFVNELNQPWDPDNLPGTHPIGTCGKQLGQHCTAVWTDKSQYQVGDQATICYSVPGPGGFQIIDMPAGSPSQVVLSGQDDGTGDCFPVRITPPTGTETVQIDFLGSSGTTQSTASTTFRVLSSTPSCAPSCPASITTDHPSYTIGDSARICFTVPGPSHVQITDYAPGESGQLIYDQDDDGTGACITGSVTLPAGTERIHLDVYQLGTSTKIAQADTSFQINPQASLLGGAWVSPADGQTTSGPIHFEADVRPASSPILRVEFTAYWSGAWTRLCVLTQPTFGTHYSCDVNLADKGAPGGAIKISFDVYNQSGGSNLSPNGERTVYYQPPATPTPIPSPHKVVIFVSGLGTSMANTAGNGDCVDTGGDYWKDIQAALASDRFGCSDFLRYSYTGGVMDDNGKWNSSPYGCFDTGDHVDYSVGKLVGMMNSYRSRHPNTQFVLIGHSLGGLIALDASDQMPAGTISSVVTIDSPLKHASWHNLNRFIHVVGILSYLSGCKKVLWDSDAARDIATIRGANSRQQASDTAESIVQRGLSKGFRFMTTGNASDCLWKPKACKIRGAWDDDSSTMTVRSANSSGLYSIGNAGCNLSNVINKKGEVQIGNVREVSCVAVSHGLALKDHHGVIPDIVNFIGQGSS